ncbi:MAG: hypothetical protein AUJ04_09315 [Acidobacteria bacterium 13_1_40CM_3_55_6]|nr:MAG: hypothetical protein AUJ04_09315 [Acidobacteria bacterium 13_1_40CM_3_55_6]
MADDIKKTIAEKLLDSFPTFVTVVGATLIILGLTGGVTYNAWLPIPDMAGRVAAAILGCVIAAAGAGFYFWNQSRKPSRIDPSAYGIKITHPREGDEVNTVDVRGTIKQGLPENHTLRLFRIYPGSAKMSPIRKATIVLSDGEWTADHCNAGGKSGDRRSIAAFIVGPSGAALIEYHDEAVRVHRKTMRELEQLTKKDRDDWLPAILVDTPDMVECHRVPIKVK